MKKEVTGNVEFLSRSGRAFGGREIAEEEDAVDTTKQDPRIVERIKVESAQTFRERFLPDLKKTNDFYFSNAFLPHPTSTLKYCEVFSVVLTFNPTNMTLWRQLILKLH